MFVVVVETEIAEDGLDAFLNLAVEHARASLENEMGCQTYDVNVDAGAGNNVMLYQVYRDAKAFEDHLETGHFHEFDLAVEPLMTSKTARVFTRET